MTYDRETLLKKIVRDSTAVGLEHHDVDHWLRVADNGVRLAQSEDVDPVFCDLFGLLHDCQRLDDAKDPDHGARAAVYARAIGKLLPLEPHDLKLMIYALYWHDDRVRAPGRKIGCCWDADRLDLVRFGTRPDIEMLNTWTAIEVAKSLEG